MNKLLGFLILFCSSAFAAENCNNEANQEIYDTSLISSLPELEKCSIKGITVENGFCIRSVYKRLPDPDISVYSIDLKKGVIQFSKGIQRPKTIKLTASQKNEIECLSYAVWVHKNQYFEEHQKAEEELKSEREKKLAILATHNKEQEIKFINECKIKNPRGSCKYIEEIISDDIGPLPDLLPNAQNDLLEFSFHYSQHLTLINGETAKVIGGESVALTNEAGKLYHYVALLFAK